MGKFRDISGQTFGTLKVLKFTKMNKFGKALFLCKCECGKLFKSLANGILVKRTKSCGCYRKNNAGKFSITHNMSKSSEYKIYHGMIKRCYNKNELCYPNYGGRGIKVSKDWLKSFSNFFRDMGIRPSKEYSLERINNNKGYSKNNCKWATISEQVINKRKRKNSSSQYFGVTKRGNRFKAQIHYKNTNYYLGSFLTEKEAALVYNKKSIELYGPNALLNKF